MEGSIMWKRMGKMLLGITAAGVLGACSSGGGSGEVVELPEEGEELSGDITMWHSFTQGARLENIQSAADEFMKEHPNVNITIETFSWDDFYTVWTTGLQSGEVPDVSTALPNHVMEMVNADAILPLNPLVDALGKDMFHENALNEGLVDDNYYSVPLYSHAQVMWVRDDILEEHNLEVPETWDELQEAATKISEDGDNYGLSVPMGTNDLMATRFLNFYVRSGGGSLLNENNELDLTNELAQEGIKYWVDMYKKASPSDSINYNVLDQATLFYQGQTAFDFNSGFHISGVEANSPDLLETISAHPIPKINKDDERQGIETSNIPMVVWKNSDHPDVAMKFVESLYDKGFYTDFLNSVPVGMLPSIEGIVDSEEFRSNETVQKFSEAVDVIQEAVESGTAIGYENGASVEAGMLAGQHVIEKMFQDIISNGTDPMEAAEKAETEMNNIFEASIR